MIDFKNFTLHQNVTNSIQNVYELKRVSTKSDYDKNKEFAFFDYLTKWIWYVKNKETGSYVSLDQPNVGLKIEPVELETLYHNFLCRKTERILYSKFKINFNSMAATDLEFNLKYKILRLPKYR